MSMSVSGEHSVSEYNYVYKTERCGVTLLSVSSQVAVALV